MTLILCPAVSPQASTNILIISSNPRNTNRLRLGTERRELEDALRDTQYRKSFSLHNIWSCRVRDITRVLDQYKPNILHFNSHGNNSTIFFENDNGEAIGVDKNALGALLKTQKGLDLVILNACYSRDQAQAIADAVGYAIGIEGAINDEEAIEFSREFYRALGDGRSFKDAFKRAQLAVGLTLNLRLHLLRRIQN